MPREERQDLVEVDGRWRRARRVGVVRTRGQHRGERVEEQLRLHQVESRVGRPLRDDPLTRDGAPSATDERAQQAPHVGALGVVAGREVGEGPLEELTAPVGPLGRSRRRELRVRVDEVIADVAGRVGEELLGGERLVAERRHERGRREEEVPERDARCGAHHRRRVCDAIDGDRSPVERGRGPGEPVRERAELSGRRCGCEPRRNVHRDEDLPTGGPLGDRREDHPLVRAHRKAPQYWDQSDVDRAWEKVGSPLPPNRFW